MQRHLRPASCLGPIDRRGFLQIGSLGLGGLCLSDLLRLRAAASEPARSADTSVILVWLSGGPSHLETYDMKPDAPSEIRGELRPIHSTVPGMDVCELLPLHARIADKFCLIRSISHQFADHGGGHKKFLTGRDPREPVGTINDYPMVGSITSKMRESRKIGAPNYVALTDAGGDNVDLYAFGSAYLGSATHPFFVSGAPTDPGFRVRNVSLDEQVAGRLDDRMRLLDDFDHLRRAVDASGAMHAMDEFNARALELLTSDRARLAFDLSRESAAVRHRYGWHDWGQRALMARRLVEAGVSFVTVIMAYPARPNETALADVGSNWDAHAVNWHLFKDARYRLPVFDQAVTALVEDLYARGLDKKVMLIVTGEFGRSPRLTYANGKPGRDHWPQAMSMLVSGGGMRMGQVVGSTNSKGEQPQDRPLVPNDLWATMFRHLAIDTEHTFPDHAGRPMSILPYGEPIRELI